jgi:uncharacterized protein YegJ (DUF2314 family)
MPDPLVSVGEKDPEMIEAIRRARESMPVFLEFVAQPKPTQRSFLLKVRFESGGEVEHIWLADLDLRSDPPRGVISNEPRLKMFRFMQQVEFEPTAVTDWMFVEDGYW